MSEHPAGRAPTALDALADGLVVDTCALDPFAATVAGVAGHESEVPWAKRDTVSTPAETKTSPSPARIACSAIRVVCSDDEQ